MTTIQAPHETDDSQSKSDRPMKPGDGACDVTDSAHAGLVLVRAAHPGQIGGDEEDFRP
ncbi:hypothetical protein GCM10018952_57610 [Streptosporangium vulgare]